MWRKIRDKYLQGIFLSGVNGILGLLAGTNDLNVMLWGQKAVVMLFFYLILISFCILTLVVVLYKERKEQYETVKRAHGEHEEGR